MIQTNFRRNNEILFLNLYKKTKQDSFDIRYRFLHFAQPTAIKHKEIREGYTDTICPRCGEHDETHEHWMFSCKLSQKLLMYLHSIFKKASIENRFENMITECLLKPLLLYVDRLPIATELYEIYFICIRHIRKDATYGDLPPEDKQMTLFQDVIKDRLTFLYNAAVLEDNLEPFLQKWNKLISKEGKITLSLNQTKSNNYRTTTPIDQRETIRFQGGQKSTLKKKLSLQNS